MQPIHSTLALLLGILYSVAISAQTNAASSKALSGNGVDRILKAPYSAQRRFLSIEKLTDGTTKRSQTGGSEARDSLGRTYSAGERHWTYLDQGKSVLKSEMLYRINDPISNTEKRWDSTTKEVKVIHWPKGASGGVPANSLNAFLNPEIPGTTVEQLGAKTIEGVVAQGTRSTYVAASAPGQNGKPVSVIHESWYCPELKIVLLEINDDPRSGTTRNELLDIRRGEPDVARYRPPADYVVHNIILPVQ